MYLAAAADVAVVVAAVDVVVDGVDGSAVGDVAVADAASTHGGVAAAPARRMPRSAAAAQQPTTA